MKFACMANEWYVEKKLVAGNARLLCSLGIFVIRMSRIVFARHQIVRARMLPPIKNAAASRMPLSFSLLLCLCCRARDLLVRLTEVWGA